MDTISPDRPSEAIRMILSVIVEQAGGDFVGVQDGVPEHHLPAHVLFNHPKHGSTLSLRLDENFSTEAIHQRLAECEERFSEQG